MTEFDFRIELIVRVRAFEKWARENELQPTSFEDWLEIFNEWMSE